MERRKKERRMRAATRLIWLAMLLMLHIPVHADGIVSTTVNMEKENLNRLKNSAEELTKAIEDLTKGVSDELKNSMGVMSDGKDMLGEVQNMIGQLDFSSITSLEKTDLSGVKDVFKKMKDNIKETTNEAKELKNKLGDIQNRVEMLVNDVKNVATLRYTMPVGIRSSSLRFEMAADTLYFRRSEDGSGNVALDAHATWTLPWTIADGEEETKIPFEGKNIVLKGSGSSRIKIGDGTDHSQEQYWTYPISKNKVYFDLDTVSYVEIDCDGFKEMYLKGRVRFASKVIFPAEPESPQDTAMSASFEVYVKDLDDMLFEAQFDKKFKIKATDDVVYETKGIVADFSTKKNAQNFDFPKGYESPFAAGDEAYWTGFAIQTLKVDMSKEFPDFPLKEAAAYNMLIDETGVSGWFSAVVEAGKENTAEENSSGGDKKDNSTIIAKFSEISIGLSHGKVSGGGLKGNLTIVPLKDSEDRSLTLDLEGAISGDGEGKLDFSVKATIARDMKYKLPFLNTTHVTIGQGTFISYEKTRLKDNTSVDPVYKKEFVLNLSGGIDMDNKLLKINGLKFENLRFSSEAPHFSKGNFSLNSIDSPVLHGLPFGLKGISTGEDVDAEGQELAVIKPDIYLTLIKKESGSDAKQGVSVEGKFAVRAHIQNRDWKVVGLKVEKIGVDISYSAFRLAGTIESFNNDPIRGDGFHGKLGFALKTPPINADAETYFGKTNYMAEGGRASEPYHYWYAYVNVDFKSPTIIFPPAVMLSGASLTVYSRMKPIYNQTTYKVTDVLPDKRNKFGFMGGLGLCVAQDNLINAKVNLGLDFSSSGGLNQATLNGYVAVISKDKEDGLLTGNFQSVYDFKNDILKIDANVTPGPKIKKFVDGIVYLKLRSYPESWFCNIGTVAEPCSLSFAGIAKASTYMMFGDSVPTYLPPLDPQICAEFNVTQSTATSMDHSGEMSDGTGFAFGAALSVDCHLNAFIYADLVFKGGTDLLVVRKPGFTCEGSKYRASGRVYVYLDAGAGIKFRKKKFEVIEFGAAADLEGELPKPIYIHGRVAFKYRLLGGLLRGNANAKFETGTKCTWSPSGGFEYSSYDGVILDEKDLDEDEASGINN